ncbi:hypothetical protein GE061_016229 [Apolygus lucorum]|uniref:Serine protease K12H4.7 n=1 Tax=Apolygus lucorum TaxID=248454 RepID=A0A8S9XHL0_APOLU|nr:hypothetical protein GE061_016229 [Apolygus lucorum]
MASASSAFNLFSYNPTWQSASTKEDKWFAQNLDHFDPSNIKIWKQRYQVNGTWFKGDRDSPIFLVIGGEASLGLINNSVRILGVEPYMHYAEAFGALCFKLEHRYYGESRPTEDLSVENLRFLSSKQALADIAHFIVGINKLYELQPTNRWILFGGSYAGSLVTWARLKFPHLIHAAVASSAPLMAKVDFKEYFEAVKQAFASSRESCAENIHQGALDISHLLEDPKGVDVLSKKFELCEPIDSLNGKNEFNLISLVTLPSVFVQYYDKFSTNVDDICDIMVDESYGSLIDRYAAVNSLILDRLTRCSQKSSSCLPYVGYKKLLDNLKNVSYSFEGNGKTIGGRQWTYQTCTEFGYFQTSSTMEQLFGPSISLKYHVDFCQDIFGGDFNLTRIDEGVEKTNTEYGGVNISVSRVIFTHGSMDPWRALGITESSNPQMSVINIPRASHCSDMGIPKLYDSHNLKTARRKIMDILSKWISE